MKHRCPDCSQSTTFEETPWWAVGKKYSVVGRHIHTGKVSVFFADDDPEKVRNHLDDMKQRCTSHEHFVLLGA